MTTVAIGIDVGGTKIAGALVTSDGAILHQQTAKTARSHGGADPSGVGTAAMVATLALRAHENNLQLAAIGIGVPEYVTRNGDIVSNEVLAWKPGGPGFEPRVPVVVDSDVRCAALAEQRCGAGRDLASFLYVSIGTGISHTLVINNVIWSGQRGEAIALGELPVESSAAIRPDAQLTVEQQASGRAIEQAHQKMTVHVDKFRASAGRIVAQALVAAVHLTDPAAVILGGGLGSSSGPYTDALRERYNELSKRRPAPPPLQQATLGPASGVIGAGLRAHQLQVSDQPTSAQ